MILGLQQGLKQDGIEVSLVKLCRWFGVVRRTVYYRATKGSLKLQEQFGRPIKAMIEESLSFGCRTVAYLLDFNKNTVRQVFRLMGWQGRKGSLSFRLPIQVLPSVAKVPDERWATDLCRIWAGKDGWPHLTLGHTRELLCWQLRRSGRSRTAEAALEQALITRYGCLGRVTKPSLLRLDNGLVFNGRSYTALVKSYGLQQGFITTYRPEQNGMFEQVIWTRKDHCVHRHRFESLYTSSRSLGMDWLL